MFSTQKLCEHSQKKTIGDSHIHRKPAETVILFTYLSLNKYFIILIFMIYFDPNENLTGSAPKILVKDPFYRIFD